MNYLLGFINFRLLDFDLVWSWWGWNRIWPTCTDVGHESLRSTILMWSKTSSWVFAPKQSIKIDVFQTYPADSTFKLSWLAHGCCYNRHLCLPLNYSSTVNCITLPEVGWSTYICFICKQANHALLSFVEHPEVLYTVKMNDPQCG